MNTRAEGSASDEAHGGSGQNAAEASPDIHDVQPTEWVSWTPFLIAIVVFGVYPQLMFKVFDPAVTQLVETISAGIPQ